MHIYGCNYILRGKYDTATQLDRDAVICSGLKYTLRERLGAGRVCITVSSLSWNVHSDNAFYFECPRKLYDIKFGCNNLVSDHE